MDFKKELIPGIEHTNKRIIKTKKIKNSMMIIKQNFIEYIELKKSLREKEKNILKELDFFYSKNSSFQFLDKEYKNFFKFKEEIEKKEILEAEVNLEKIKEIDNNFTLIDKKSKEYFQSEKKLKYYKKKYLKLKKNSRNKDKILRNKVKLEYSEKLCNHFIKEIKYETNSINLSRFFLINPIIKNLFSFNISTNLILNENFENLEGFDKILLKLEKNDYNIRFFDLVDVKKNICEKNLKKNRFGDKKKFKQTIINKKNQFLNEVSVLKPFDDKISLLENKENKDYFLNTLNSKKKE